MIILMFINDINSKIVHAKYFIGSQKQKKYNWKQLFTAKALKSPTSI